MLNLNSNEFWSMSHGEFLCLYDGYIEINGLQKKEMTWTNVLELMEEGNIPLKSASIKNGKNSS